MPIHTNIRGRLAVACVAVGATALAIPLGIPPASPAHSAVGGGTRALNSVRLVGTAFNKKLHRRILVSRRGRSLYALSAEKRGRFICTNRACLSFWAPLLSPRGKKPTGVRALGTIRRPGGQRQVTYRGRPLYTFNDDRRPGDVRGEGFVDVGTWHAVVVRG
jgi:predicted lipoprotein with Yx(FWY)xxD motif